MKSFADTNPASPKNRDSGTSERAKMTRGKGLRVVLQYNSLPHYREALFRKFADAPDIEYVIVADSQSETPHLRVIPDPSEKFSYVHSRTRILRLSPSIQLFWQPSAVKACFRVQPHAVIALGNPYSLTAWALLLIGWFKGIPVLLWGHGLLKKEHGPKWWLRRLFYGLAAGHLLYGHRAKELLSREGFPSERLFVIYNSLDFDAQSSVAQTLDQKQIETLKAQLEVPLEAGLVVFIGRLQPVKRLDLLLRAIAILDKRSKDVHALFIGSGDEAPRLRALTHELRMQHKVHFVDESYDERFLGTALSAADACVIPAGAGLTVMHALAYGTPVVLSDDLNGHFPEFEAIDEGITGRFFRDGDATSLAAIIEDVVCQVRTDPSIRDACVKAIQDRYTAASQAERFSRALHEVVQFPGLWGFKTTIKEAYKALRMAALAKTKFRSAKFGKGSNVGRRVKIHPGGFVAGDYVYIGPDCEIAPEVKIGSYTCVSSDVVIVGADHVIDRAGVPIRFAGRPESVVTTIGRDVLIGHGASVMRGVTIGDGSIIGTRAVVTTDIPPYSIAVGAPARVIRKRFNASDEIEHGAMLDEPPRYWGDVPRPT